MTVHTRDDSDGNSHQVWAQRQAMSCAIASMWMARNQVKQMTFAEGEWGLAQRAFQNAVQGVAWAATDPGSNGGGRTIDGAAATAGSSDAMFGSSGTGPSLWRSAMQGNGIKVLQTLASGTFPHRLNTARLGLGTPALVGVGWWTNSGGSWTRNSGHVIVATGVNSRGQIIYLDPWGAVLREVGNNGRYQATGWVEVVQYLSQA